MASGIFCIVIPLMVMTPKGKSYIREDRYECFSSQSTCDSRLKAEQRYLRLVQSNSQLPKPYCKAEGTNSVDDKMSLTGNDLSPVEKAWYKFW